MRIHICDAIVVLDRWEEDKMRIREMIYVKKREKFLGSSTTNHHNHKVILLQTLFGDVVTGALQ